MTSLTRGPMPSSVYWRRRAVLALLVLSLVVIAIRTIGGGPAAPASGGALSPEAAQSSETTAATDGARRTPQERAARRAARRDAAAQDAERGGAPVPVTLPAPDGACVNADVVVTPVVDDADAGAPVTVVLNLRTLTAEACTWQISPANLSMKITSGSDDIWSSQQCRTQLPTRKVTVRRDTTSTTSIPWNARRSEDGCPGNTQWAVPGYYYVDASALGGEPRDVQFELIDPATLPQPTPVPAPGRSTDRSVDRPADRSADRGKSQAHTKQR